MPTELARDSLRISPALRLHTLAVHTGVDRQALGRTPLGDLGLLAGPLRGARLAVADGIDRATAAPRAFVATAGGPDSP